MKIWVDADACPVVIKEILYRAADRTGILVTLVANKTLRIPRSDHIAILQVDYGFDVADNEIVKRLNSGDLVITADIPLADRVIGKGATVLDPRGTLLTEANIKERLATRDLLDELRSAELVGGGPSAFGARDTQAFANELNRFLQANPTGSAAQAVE